MQSWCHAENCRARRICLRRSRVAAEVPGRSRSPTAATIKGKVIYKGTVPTKTVLPTKDKETCGGPRKEPLVVVGPGGEVKDAVVHLKEIAKGKDWAEAAEEARSTT